MEMMLGLFAGGAVGMVAMWAIMHTAIARAYEDGIAQGYHDGAQAERLEMLRLGTKPAWLLQAEQEAREAEAERRQRTTPISSPAATVAALEAMADAAYYGSSEAVG